MLDDAARSPRGDAHTSFHHRAYDDRRESSMTRAFYRSDSRDDFDSTNDRRRSRPHPQHAQHPQYVQHPPDARPVYRRQPRSSPSPTSSGSGSGSSAFRGRDFFKCPELDQRMKKYLVRLANETANHLIRDTLEPEHANLVWKPMTSTKGIEILRGHDRVVGDANNSNNANNANTPDANTSNNANANPPTSSSSARDSTCLRGVAQVNASIEEFAMLFKLDTNKRLAEHGLLFNPDLLDMATLYSLVPPSGDQPRRYVGIKWCLMQSPSRLFRNRDFCYLECQKEFRDARGRRGWVRSMHSIKMPCCPSLEKSHSIVRASLYRCGLIAVETDKPGVLDTTYTIEMDLKGHFPELFQPKFLSQRIAALASIDKYLQQQRLSSSPLLGDLDIPASKVKGTCHFCFREFATFTKRHVCRKCGEGVCKSCSDDWHLDVPVIGRKKVRICTVCSAEARYCHSTPMTARDTYSGGLGTTSAGHALMEGAYRQPSSRHLRRSQSTPSQFDFGNIPEPSPSISSRTTYEQSPSEYFAAQLRQQQDPYNHSHQPSYSRTPSRRESDALYRESDFATNFDDLQHGAIRGTADLTGLWTEEDASPFQQARGESSAPRRASRAMPLRRGTTTPEPERPSHRSRAPTFATDPSSFDHSNEENSSYENDDGHFPPSSRYVVMDNRLERVNSFDAARKLEEQRHRPHQSQYQDQQRHTAYYGNSRRSPQSMEHGFLPHHRGRQNSAASPSHYRFPSPDSNGSAQYASDNERRRPLQQHQPRSSTNIRLSRGPAGSSVSSSPAPSPAPRNIALEFLAKTQKQPAPRNIAMEFAANKQQKQQPQAAPPNIAMAFATGKQHQPQQPQPAPRNIAMEFLANMQQPPSRAETKTKPFAPTPPQRPTFQFGSAASKRGNYQPEPPQSPEIPTEPVEYVESESGEWIRSDRWEKGVLNRSFLDLDGGQLALETQACETCGAKQYVHDGVIEATTCDCAVDEDLMKPSMLSGQPTRDESRSSFYGGGLYDGDFVLGERPSMGEPSFSDLNGYSRRSSTMEDSGDIDAVIPLLVERLSQHSLRSSFQN